MYTKSNIFFFLFFSILELFPGGLYYILTFYEIANLSLFQWNIKTKVVITMVICIQGFILSTKYVL